MLLRATRLGRSAMQHIELVSKEQDFSMQRSPRPEDRRPDQPTKIAHQNEVSTDSQTIVSRFQFAVGTTVQTPELRFSAKSPADRGGGRSGHPASSSS